MNPITSVVVLVLFLVGLGAGGFAFPGGGIHFYTRCRSSSPRSWSRCR